MGLRWSPQLLITFYIEGLNRKLTGTLQNGNVPGLRGFCDRDCFKATVFRVPMVRWRATVSEQRSIRNGFWEGDGKDAPLLRAAHYADIPAVSSGDGPGQAEAKPCSGL